MRSRGWICLVVLTFVPRWTQAQHNSYAVKLTCTGYIGSMNFAAGEPGCPAAGDYGTDVYEGCLSGNERELVTEQEVFYHGNFQRSTDVWACDAKRLADGTDAFCASHIGGSAKVTGDLSIYADRDGAYVTFKPRPGQGPAAVTGDCDPELTAELAADYPASEGAEIEDVPAGPLRVGRYGEGPDPKDPFAPGTCVLEVLQRLDACP